MHLPSGELAAACAYYGVSTNPVSCPGCVAGVGEMEVADGDEAVPPGRPCERCSCAAGVLSCRGPECDCSGTGGHSALWPPRACCPQCDPSASCRHQELHHVVFRSGERWIYQCQTCECLVSWSTCCSGANAGALPSTATAETAALSLGLHSRRKHCVRGSLLRRAPTHCRATSPA